MHQTSINPFSHYFRISLYIVFSYTDLPTSPLHLQQIVSILKYVDPLYNYMLVTNNNNAKLSFSGSYITSTFITKPIIGPQTWLIYFKIVHFFRPLMWSISIRHIKPYCEWPTTIYTQIYGIYIVLYTERYIH